MDLTKVLQQLHEELENLNAAISSLERLQEAAKHRGKQPEWLGDLTSAVRGGRKAKSGGKLKGDLPEVETTDGGE
jgi:hypothetical protein